MGNRKFGDERGSRDLHYKYSRVTSSVSALQGKCASTPIAGRVQGERNAPWGPTARLRNSVRKDLGRLPGEGQGGLMEGRQCPGLGGDREGDAMLILVNLTYKVQHRKIG